MTPGAHLQAAADLLDDILAGGPAEKVLTGWARRSRFAGSKDRAAVRDHVFQALRCRRSYAALGGADTGRGLMIGLLRAAGTAPEALFDGRGHAPPPLTAAETEAAHNRGRGDAMIDLPAWLLPDLRDSLGTDLTATATALQARAPVMLRVNLRKGSLRDAVKRLSEDGVATIPHSIAATALRVESGARRVGQTAAYREGLAELQDGSGQAAMAALDLPPDARVLDYCAGGGGKLLALAARTRGKWYAHDAAPARMADLPARAARAGVAVTLLDWAGCKAEAPFDLVLCDAPCSGSGTWRRTPDAKWRLTAAQLNDLIALQARILDAAAPLVGPNGILAYATCSVLRRENEARIEAFCASYAGWAPDLQRRWPVGAGGDGFFMARLRRV